MKKLLKRRLFIAIRLLFIAILVALIVGVIWQFPNSFWLSLNVLGFVVVGLLILSIGYLFFFASRQTTDSSKDEKEDEGTQRERSSYDESTAPAKRNRWRPSNWGWLITVLKVAVVILLIWFLVWGPGGRWFMTNVYYGWFVPLGDESAEMRLETGHAPIDSRPSSAVNVPVGHYICQYAERGGTTFVTEYRDRTNGMAWISSLLGGGGVRGAGSMEVRWISTAGPQTMFYSFSPLGDTCPQVWTP